MNENEDKLVGFALMGILIGIFLGVFVFPHKAEAAEVIDTYAGTPANSVSIGGASSNIYWAQQFQPFSFEGFSISVLNSLRLYSRIDDGTPTDGFVIEIWTDVSGEPGVLVSGATETVAPEDIVVASNYLSFNAAEYTEVIFSSPPELDPTLPYWIIISRSGSEDFSNYRNNWSTEPGTYDGFSLVRSDDEETWEIIDASIAYQLSFDSGGTPTPTPGGNNCNELYPSWAGCTQTVDNPVLNLWLGIILMYLTAWGVIGFFKRQ